MRPLSVQRWGMGILSHGLLPFPSLLSSHKCSPSLSEPHRFRHMRAFSPRKIEMIPMSDEATWNMDAVFTAYDHDALNEKTKDKYRYRDPDGRLYRLDNLISPNPDRPNL